MSAVHTNRVASLPSQWVVRFAPMIRTHGKVLDLACGGGRHARLLARLGCHVEAVDRDRDALVELQGVSSVTPRYADLEQGEWPYDSHQFDAVVVTNYLFRPLLPKIIRLVESHGLLIYETFMLGNEQFGKPSNPEFLLRENELFDLVAKSMHVVAFEQGPVVDPRHAVTQRLCAKGHRYSNMT